MLPEKDKIESNLSTAARKKLFYGWVAVIAGTFIIFIAGNFQYSFGVFVKPLINKFGWSRAAISGTVTTRSITSSLASPIAGVLGDRYGFKSLILIGLCLVGLSYLLTSRITSLWQLYLSLGALTGIGISTFYVPIIAIATKWFGSRAGLANGIIMSGFGWAQIITPPVATYLILRYSWETSCIVLGIAALVLGTAAWRFIRTPPNSLSQPLAEPTEGDIPKTGVTINKTEDNYTLAEAIRTPALWNIFLILMLAAGCYQLVIIHIVAAATDTGITPGAAAIILTFTGITNTLGRLMLGGLAMRIGNKTVLTFSVAIQALALFFWLELAICPPFILLPQFMG